MEAKRIILAALAGCCIVTWCAERLAGQQQKPFTVMRIYTAQDGEARAEQVEMKLPDTIHTSEATIQRFPPGWVRDRRPADRRQFAITLSGRAEVEVAAGQKFLVEPGQVLLAEDLTGKGHITRTVGNSDWVVMAIKVADK